MRSFIKIYIILLCAILLPILLIAYLCIKNIPAEDTVTSKASTPEFTSIIDNIKETTVAIKTKILGKSLQIILVGTVIDEAYGSVACIRHIPSGYEGAYRVGDRIKDAVITKITQGEVELTREDGRKELLQVARFSSNEPTIENIVSEYQNPNNILKEISILPAISDGKIKGFKISKIEEDSIVEKSGFKEGDIIKRVNGYSITSIKHAKRLYEQLTHEYNTGTIEPVEINFERDGKLQSIVYPVR